MLPLVAGQSFAERSVVGSSISGSPALGQSILAVLSPGCMELDCMDFGGMGFGFIHQPSRSHAIFDLLDNSVMDGEEARTDREDNDMPQGVTLMRKNVQKTVPLLRVDTRSDRRPGQKKLNAATYNTTLLISSQWIGSSR